jgi:hypothetical protein
LPTPKPFAATDDSLSTIRSWTKYTKMLIGMVMTTRPRRSGRSHVHVGAEVDFMGMADVLDIEGPLLPSPQRLAFSVGRDGGDLASL